jgi:single-strand DNA-binding protein
VTKAEAKRRQAHRNGLADMVHEARVRGGGGGSGGLSGPAPSPLTGATNRGDEMATKKQEETTGRPRIVGKVGNLTKDPELKFSANGTAYARAGLAVNVQGADGNWDQTEFYELTAFQTLAEHLAELEKGTRVVVVGRGEIETYTTKDGEERTSKKIVCDGIGPDLRFATAAVTKMARKGPGNRTSTPMNDDEEAPF